MKQKIKIAITDCGKYDNYEKWVLAEQDDIEVVNLSYKANNANLLKECDGIILTGGEDVHPKFYHKEEYLQHLNPGNIDEQRDVFELNIIKESFTLNKPMLGICRGLQLVNVFLGGTLIYDISAVSNIFIHGKIKGEDQRHTLKAAKDSLLYNITNTLSGEVNSAHHQSADVVAENLKVIATSESIAEAMQWKDSQNKSWLLLVQWHPERMADQQNPFASALKKTFIRKCKEHQIHFTTIH